MKIISDKSINYPFAIVVWAFLTFFLSLLISLLFGNPNEVLKWIILIGSGIFTLSSGKTIPLRESRQLVFLGEQTGVWLTEGFYFLFHLYSLDYKEKTQSIEKKNIAIEPFNIQDKNGKLLLGAINGTWQIGNSNTEIENYKLIDADVLSSNLKTLLRRTSNIVFGKKDYWNEIIGQDLSQILMTDQIFITECQKYGIRFTNLVVEITSGNLLQDNLNAYRSELTAKFKSLYPTMSDVEISNRVEIQIQIAKKFTVDGNLFNK